ncbi:MAG: formylmethanofuran dehydrogenase subunit A [Methanobacteriota archaeon]
MYDPLNKIDGEKKDVFVKDGKIVEEADGKTIDASGLIVLPGGVDIHSHIAGSKVNAGRLLRPEDHRKDVVARAKVTRSGVGYTVPTTFVTGYRYATLGYTTVMEAAIPPLGARHAHEELNDTPIIDKGAFVLMDNNYFVLKYVEQKEFDKLKNFVAWLLEATRGYAIKIVNPGGVENWKWGKNVEGLDDKVLGFNVTPREVVTSLVKVNEELGLPHSVHTHCNNLGSPGNIKTTLDTMDAVRGRIHITHVQFNAYAGDDWANMRPGSPEIASYINKHQHATCDMGQIIFGDATTMTADGHWQYRLSKLSGNKWYNSDVEMEAGAGIVPYVFRKKSLANAIQWTIGLEVALLIDDPWKVYLTTDHPNAGLFYYYPKIISWLMNKKKRDETLAEVHKKTPSRTSLASIDREYSLYEIATITRAATAKSLGLKNKGHLGAGADADVAIYEFREDDIEGSFSRAKYVVKDGEIVVKDGEVVKDYQGRTFWVKAGGKVTDEIREVFSKYYTVGLENYPVQDEYLPRQEEISCR